MSTSCSLTLELVLTGVVQGLLGLDRRPEMLAYQIPSHGEIFMLIACRAASQRQWSGTGMGKVLVVLGTSLLNLPCNEKKGLVKEMTVRNSGPAPRAAATKRQDGVLSQIRVPGSQNHTSLLLSVHTNTLLV